MFDFLRKLSPVGPIRTKEMRYHISSYADPHGRVFFTRDGRLCRGIAESGAALADRLINDGIVQDLVERRLLVPTRRSAQSAEGFVLVLEHERIEFVSYPYEWGVEMLRAAALHTLELLDRLAHHGLTLKDAHGWNILFEGTRPVFVDFGSIVEIEPGSPWKAEQQFQEYFLHPIAMMGAGHDRIARALLRDFEHGISLQTCASIAGLGVPQRPAEAEPFAWYRQLISSYDFKPSNTAWSAYYEEAFPPFQPDNSWTEKHHALGNILKQYRPRTVLDIGSNRGWYAMLAASVGARVVAFDNDVVCINHLYNDASVRGLDIQPLAMSCLNPSPRYGMGGGVMESAVERLQVDMVLGLALVHHMVFRMHLRFDQIAAALAAYTQRMLVVEFPPKDDVHVSQWITESYAWYTVENFKAALGVHFPRISIVASHPAPRLILICER